MPLRHMLGVSSPHRVVYIIMSCWLARLPRSPATCQVSQFYEAKGLNVTNIQNPGSELVPGKTEGLYFLTCSHLAGLIPGQGTRDWFPCVTTGKALDSGPDAKCLTWQHRDLGWECCLWGHLLYTCTSWQTAFKSSISRKLRDSPDHNKHRPTLKRT